MRAALKPRNATLLVWFRNVEMENVQHLTLYLHELDAEGRKTVVDKLHKFPKLRELTFENYTDAVHQFLSTTLESNLNSLTIDCNGTDDLTYLASLLEEADWERKKSEPLKITLDNVSFEEFCDMRESMAAAKKDTFELYASNVIFDIADLNHLTHWYSKHCKFVTPPTLIIESNVRDEALSQKPETFVFFGVTDYFGIRLKRTSQALWSEVILAFQIPSEEPREDLIIHLNIWELETQETVSSVVEIIQQHPQLRHFPVDVYFGPPSKRRESHLLVSPGGVVSRKLEDEDEFSDDP